MKKILFVTANGVGLGHIRRSSLVAEAILRENKNINILFATMCKKVKFLQELDIPYFKLKCLSDEILDDHEEFKKTKTFNAIAYEEILTNYEPDLVIVDIHIILKSTYYDFLFSEKYNNIKKIFLFRINDSKNFKETVYKNKKINQFTKVIIPHSVDELRFVLSSEDIDFISENKKFFISGPILKKEDEEYNIKQKYNIKENDFLITMALGGGGAFNKGGCESALSRIEDFLENYDKIYKKISNLKTIIILGPLFNIKKFKKYIDVIKKYKIRIIEFEENIISLYKSSGILITTTGYNTANEISVNKIPTILTPIKRGDDQFLRAEYLKSKGIVEIYNPDKDNFYNVISEVYDNLSIMKKSFENFSVTPGNEKVAQEIINLLTI
jgi:predicted glycosyltransferase